MSSNYQRQIEELCDWFKLKLSHLPDIVISQSDYSAGVDSLNEPHASLIKLASQEWMMKRKYELSYNQMCNSFFRAANELGKLRAS